MRLYAYIGSVLLLLLLHTFGLSQEITHNHSVIHSFMENKGQWTEDVLFKSKFSGGNLWIQQHKFIFQLQDFSALHASHFHNEHNNHKHEHTETLLNREHVVHFNFLNSNRVKEIEKTGQTSFYHNYFTGNDPTKWASEVHGYSEAVLKNLYDGIDLKLIERKDHLKYEFHVAELIDPKQIQVDIAGASSIHIDQRGNLHITTPAGNIMEEKPYAYQIKNGKIVEIDCHFQLNDYILTFDLGTYDPTVSLVIDPTLIFATYSGAISDNFGMTATYAHDGSAYAGGTIYGNNYPTPAPAYDTTSNFTVPIGANGITDVFISKYSSDGSLMLWTSFIGGGNNTVGTETVHSLIADSLDNVYFFGATSSTDFPTTTNAFQTTHAGGKDSLNFLQNGVHFKTQGTDIYVAKLSANGQNLMGSTFIGGSDNDGVNYRKGMSYTPNWGGGIYHNINDYDSLTPNYGDNFRGEIMLDKNNNCIVASCTHSLDFPLVNPFQPTFGGGAQDGVIFKLSSDLQTLMWSSYYGGSKDDVCNSVKVDTSGNVIVGGGTCSNDLLMNGLPLNGWQQTYNGGKTDGFILKIAPDGQTILKSSYVGTSNWDQVFIVEVNRVNQIYALGLSAGGTFPVLNAGYFNTGSSQFIAQLDSNITVLNRSMVFGSGSAQTDISLGAFMVDVCGNMYVSGWGKSLLLGNSKLTNMPLKDALQSTSDDNYSDFYLFALKHDWSDILFGTYLGGSQSHDHVDGGTSRFDRNGIVYQSVCGGCGGKSDFDFSYSQNQNPWSLTNKNTSNLNCNNFVFKLDFNLIPHAEITADKIIGCAPFTVSFTNYSSPSDSSWWEFGNGDFELNDPEPIKTFPDIGNYEVKFYVTDSTCLFTDTAKITITVTDSIVLSTSPDITLCTPVSSSFTAFTEKKADYFIWSSDDSFSDTLNSSTNDSTLIIVPSEPYSVYYIKAGNDGCFKIDSVRVDFVGSSIDILGKDSICKNETTTLTITNSNPIVQFSYSWNPDSIIVSGQNTAQIIANPTFSQWIYVDAATSDGNCVAKDSIWITVSTIEDSLVKASAEPLVVFSGGTTQLQAEPSGYTYNWTASGLVDFQSSTTLQTLKAKVHESTMFTVAITDGICTKEAEVWVEAKEFVCSEEFVYIPNAFSPNGDGENDVLRIYGDMIYTVLLRIYNRWGELVFETNERSEYWDGTYNGQLLEPDVYDYYLQVECINGEENIIKGNVTLMR